MGSCAAPSAKGDDKFITTDYLQQCPREATEKSMGEISGALVAIALVLSAVFLPMAFFGGSTGVIYRQFSVTIIGTVANSRW